MRLFLQVQLNDSLSQLMCVPCINFINDSYKFRKKCEDAQKSLLEHLNQKSLYEIKIEPSILKTDAVASIDISDLVIDNDFRDYDDNITLSEYYVEIEKNKQEETFQNDQIIDNTTENYPTSEQCDKNNDKSAIKLNHQNSPKKAKSKEKLQKNKEKTAKKRGRTKKENQEEKRTKEKKDRVKEEIQCELCHKVLTSKLSLRNHNKIHTGFDVVCEVNTLILII